MRFWNFFRRQPVERSVSAPKNFRFAVYSTEKVIEIYEYTVQAVNRKEAQRLMLAYFYGTGELYIQANQKVKSDHREGNYPLHSVDNAVRENNIFSVFDGQRFAKKLAGWVRKEDMDWLRQKAQELDVPLGKDHIGKEETT